MRHRIALIGCGGIGSRYLQGLKQVPLPLDIQAIDSNPTSLTRARSVWETTSSEQQHQVQFFQSVDDLQGDYSLLIVATGANVRRHVLSLALQRASFQYTILEKLLAQSCEDLSAICELVRPSSKCWVNTPMRSWSLYKNLIDHIGDDLPRHVKFVGFSNLVCNAIHYIDLVAGWTNTRLTNIDSSCLAQAWHDTKRPGFLDVYGELRCTFSNGTILLLRSNEDEKDYQATVETSQSLWSIEEPNGIAREKSGATVSGRCEFQSELTPQLVAQILTEGHCHLPSLEFSAALHRPLLEAAQAHWNLSGQTGTIPVT